MKIEDLIEELESLRARIHPRALSAAQYEVVGWADRPLRHLIDQCREEQESQSWAEKHARDFLPLLGADLGTELLPEPLPRRALVSDGVVDPSEAASL